MNQILISYFPVADMIAATFGNTCEVTVHDLTQPKTSVVHVAGNVTGRAVGQSFDHIIKKVLLSDNFQENQTDNYIFTTPDGKTIKSSTALIRDGKKAIGALCINVDITTSQRYYKELTSFFAETAEEPSGDEVETTADVSSIIDDLIENILSSTDLTDMNRKKAVEIVKFMDEKGIFLVKGAIDKVAARLGVSKVTIYSYLDEAKGKR